MKPSALLVASGLLAAPSAWAGAPVLGSTFDADLEGWTAVGFDVETDPVAIAFGAQILTQTDNSADMVFDAGGVFDPLFGGNGGGFARFADVIEDPGSFAQAPGDFLGDLSAYLGGTVSFDHRLFDQGTPASSIGPYTIVFISGDLEDADINDLNIDAYGVVLPGPNLGDADTGWVTISAEISDVGLMPFADMDLGTFDPSLAGDTPSDFGVTTNATLADVLANVDQILVSFELVDNDSTQNTEAGGIDNFSIAPIPEPGSLALLGLGGLTLLRRRR